MTELNTKKILAKECRHVTHIRSRHGSPDLHLIKELVHYEDGTSEPKLQWVKDFKRSFFVTSPQYRSYKQKKEVEELGKLMKYTCTQSELRDKIAAALDLGYSNDQIKKLSNSPYLYGSEITSSAILKNMYMQKNKTHITPYTVMGFDIETDMLNGTDDPIITTAVMGNKIFIGVIKSFIAGIADTESRFRSKCTELLTNVVMPNYEIEVGGKKQAAVLNIGDYEITYAECDGTVDLIRKTFVWVHALKPDFLAIWNMDFDIPRIIETLKKYNVDPATVLCDPSIPPQYRVCDYRQGLKKKRKANGQEIPIDPADQWHSLTLTASFYVIDAMCSYRLLRLAQAKEVNYRLDTILNKELGVRKLKFKEADAYKEGRWHIFMQQEYKIEYMVYGMFDSLSMKLLDEKIMDLSFRMSGYAGMTPFARCNSKPKMIADALHYYVLEKGYVINSIGEQLEYPAFEEEDEEEKEFGDDTATILGLRNWIMTLPAHLVAPGLPLIQEFNLLMTKLRAFVYDSDCVSAYPTVTSICNVSKSTTKRELINIDGIPEEVFRLQNINLCSGYVNSLEYGNTMFGLPSLTELEDMFDTDVTEDVSVKRLA